MDSPPRTPEYYPAIPRTPPPIRRNTVATPPSTPGTPDTVIEDWPIAAPLFADDDDETVAEWGDNFDDFHFPAPIPLVHQNAVEGTVHQDVPPVVAPAPVGIAYEIHNYANDIRPEPVLSTLENITGKSRNTYTNIPHATHYMKLHILHNFTSSIRGNARYSEQDKDIKLRKFYQIFDAKIKTFRFEEDPVEAQMIGLSVYYMLDFNKSDILRQLYIDTFLTDCLEAYNVRPGEPLSGMSCTHGVIERLYTSVPQAIRQRFIEPNVGRFRMSNKQRNEYTTILEAFESHARIIAEINAAVIDWFDRADRPARPDEPPFIVPEGFTQRKQALTHHIVQYLNQHGIQDIHENSPEITSFYSANAWLANSLSRNPPVMGGKKSNKSMKKRRGEKSKRVRRQMRSATRKQRRNKKR